MHTTHEPTHLCVERISLLAELKRLEFIIASSTSKVLTVSCTDKIEQPTTVQGPLSLRDITARSYHAWCMRFYIMLPIYIGYKPSRMHGQVRIKIIQTYVYYTCIYTCIHVPYSNIIRFMTCSYVRLYISTYVHAHIWGNRTPIW